MTTKATASLPAILAVTGCYDGGPCDGGPTATCPHCGAGGRYIWSFICADGSRRGAMSGCIQLYPSDRHSRLIQEAFNRRMKAKEEGRSLASWWAAMIEATEAFAAKELRDHQEVAAATAELHAAVREAEGRRQSWLHRNGYGRRGRRGRIGVSS